MVSLGEVALFGSLEQLELLSCLLKPPLIFSFFHCLLISWVLFFLSCTVFCWFIVEGNTRLHVSIPFVPSLVYFFLLLTSSFLYSDKTREFHSTKWN